MEYENIINDIEENFNDYDTLVIGKIIIEKAMNRLENDINNKEIRKEYIKLKNIVKQLQEIIENYV